MRLLKEFSLEMMVSCPEIVAAAMEKRGLNLDSLWESERTFKTGL